MGKFENDPVWTLQLISSQKKIRLFPQNNKYSNGGKVLKNQHHVWEND